MSVFRNDLIYKKKQLRQTNRKKQTPFVIGGLTGALFTPIEAIAQINNLFVACLRGTGLVHKVFLLQECDGGLKCLVRFKVDTDKWMSGRATTKTLTLHVK